MFHPEVDGPTMVERIAIITTIERLRLKYLEVGRW